MSQKTEKIFAEQLAEKLMDAANIGFGALVVGQFLGSQGFSWALAITGVGLWIVLYGLSYLVIKYGMGD
jgi:hypothetical protein